MNAWNITIKFVAGISFMVISFLSLLVAFVFDLHSAYVWFWILFIIGFVLFYWSIVSARKFLSASSDNSASDNKTISGFVEQPAEQVSDNTAKQIPGGEEDYNLVSVSSDDNNSSNEVYSNSTEDPAKRVSDNTAKQIPDGEKDYNLFYDVVETSVLSYKYEESLCLFAGASAVIAGNGGQALTFKQEPENPHDEKAVAVYLNDIKIGYIYRGLIQDMFNDYTNRGWIVMGYLNKYSVAEEKATYKIGFYKPLEKFKSKKFSLTKIRKKIDDGISREDHLAACSEGDSITVEYSGFDEGYVVFDDMYNEIGELPKSAEAFIEGEEHSKIVGILDSIDEDDNGRLKAKADVYLVK